MKHFYITILLALMAFQTRAQVTSPGNGSVYTLDDLVSLSAGAVTFSDGSYQINNTVTIATNDVLNIINDAVVKFASGTYLEIKGSLNVNPPTSVKFTAADPSVGYSGVWINESIATTVKKLTFEYATSFKISYCSPDIEDCIFQFNNINKGTSFGNGAIALGFNSNPVIRNCQFLNNERAAIQSGANANSAPQIISSYFFGNNTANVNVPQINLGASGPDTIKILDNKILNSGSLNAGGISILPLGTANIIISGNEIKNNRYGINLQGGADLFSIVSYNRIDSNNIQGNPNLGGSGIAFSGGSVSSHQQSIVKGNTFTANLWGITIQGGATPNIGNLDNADTTDNGGNNFINNTNSGTPGVDLYNNSPNYIYAQGNYWNTNDPLEVAAKIFDIADNAALGTVNYTSFLLPLQLSQFTAQTNNDGVLLNWQTASESNSSHFVIMRSNNGSDYAEIGNVGASGHTSTSQNYSFTDATSATLFGNIFYKLKMVDKDGSASYSKVVRIIIQNNQNVIRKIFPTVFSGQQKLTALIASTSEKEVLVQILNSNGKVLSNAGKYRLLPGVNTIEILAAQQLPKGMLLIRFVSKDFESTQAVIRQ